MVTRIIVAALAAVLLLTESRAGEGWYNSYEEAREVSERDGLPLLIHFHASYCGPCRSMNAQVFSQPDVRKQLREGIAAVEIDVQRQPELAQQYGATTVPRDVVVFPGKTSETLNVGFKSALQYRDLLRSVAVRGSQFAKKTEKHEPSATEPKLAQKQITGLEGFCPVRLMQKHEWIRGQKDLVEVHRGITYYFSGREARDEFRKNPNKYTPQNLGCDPVLLYSDQQAVVGRIRFGAFFDNQLFLFASFENRKTFKENPLKYGRIRHALKIDDLGNRHIQ